MGECVRACVRSCVRACVRACVCACVRACVRACMCVCGITRQYIYLNKYIINNNLKYIYVNFIKLEEKLH